MHRERGGRERQIRNGNLYMCHLSLLFFLLPFALSCSSDCNLSPSPLRDLICLFHLIIIVSPSCALGVSLNLAPHLGDRLVQAEALVEKRQADESLHELERISEMRKLNDMLDSEKVCLVAV